MPCIALNQTPQQEGTSDRVCAVAIVCRIRPQDVYMTSQPARRDLAAKHGCRLTLYLSETYALYWRRSPIFWPPKNGTMARGVSGWEYTSTLDRGPPA